MGFEQAFHTSCRVGLGAQAGFQFNAASPGLTEQQLAELARVHAGYQAPPGMPAEPSKDDLREFPISLKFAPVEGVGPAVSNTCYVGREYRGRNGEADSGRFGNYFS